MSQQIFLKWNNHTTIIDEFKKLLSAQLMVDVTLACGGKSLKAHKLVLSACSSYFLTLFAENPCKHPVIILKDVKFTDLKAIIDFMYNGEVSVTEDQLEDLIRTAETLRVKVLGEVMIAAEPEKQFCDESQNQSANLEDELPNIMLQEQPANMLEIPSENVLKSQSANVIIEKQSANVEVESQSASIEMESQSADIEVGSQSDNVILDQFANVSNHFVDITKKQSNGNKTENEIPIIETKTCTSKKKKGKSRKRVTIQSANGVHESVKEKSNNVGAEKALGDMEIDAPLLSPSHSVNAALKSQGQQPNEENEHMSNEDSPPIITEQTTRPDDQSRQSKDKQHQSKTPEQFSWNSASTPLLPASFVVLRDVMTLINNNQESKSSPDTSYIRLEPDASYVRLEPEKKYRKISEESVCQSFKLQKHKAKAGSPFRKIQNDESSSRKALDNESTLQKVTNDKPSPSRISSDDSSSIRISSEDPFPKRDLNENSPPKNFVNDDSSSGRNLKDDGSTHILEKIKSDKEICPEFSQKVMFY